MMILNDLYTVIHYRKDIYRVNNFVIRYNYVIYPVEILSILHVSANLLHAHKVHVHVPTTKFRVNKGINGSSIIG